MAQHIDTGQRKVLEKFSRDIFLYIPFHVEDLKTEMNVLIRNNRFLRKSFLERIFGKKF